MNKVFSYVSKKLQNCLKGYYDSDVYNLSVINQVRLQYSSIIYLIKRSDIDSMNTTNEMLDIASVNCIIRTIYENYLIFHFIYGETKKIEKGFRFRRFGIGRIRFYII